MIKPAAISTENRLNNGDERNVEDYERVQAEKGKSCVYHGPINGSITCSTLEMKPSMCLPLGNIRSPGVTSDHLSLKKEIYTTHSLGPRCRMLRWEEQKISYLNT